ncbi:GTP 3',8-cyclase [compost metagenome]
MDRLNISLDSLRRERFAAFTRSDRLEQVLAGIDAARAAGFQRIKLNCVVQRGRNDDEVCDLVEFALARGLDISFIEEMPLGSVSSHSRAHTLCSSDEVRRMLSERWSLTPSLERSGGPSRYYRIDGHGSRIGFISPHSHNFCATCNRVRLTVEGRLLLCLGNEHSVDLKHVLRAHPGNPERLEKAIRDSLHLKPYRHHFEVGGDVQILRFMNMTGG